jgi:hypothetical protein
MFHCLRSSLLHLAHVQQHSTSHLDVLKLHRQESAAAHYQRKCAWSNEPKHAALSHVLSAMRRSLLPAATVADITRMEATAAEGKNVARSAWSHTTACLAHSSQKRNNSQARSLRPAPALPQCLISVNLSATTASGSRPVPPSPLGRHRARCSVLSAHRSRAKI